MNDQNGVGGEDHKRRDLSRENAALPKTAKKSVNTTATGIGNWIICQYDYPSKNLMYINHDQDPPHTPYFGSRIEQRKKEFPEVNWARFKRAKEKEHTV